MLHMNTVLEQVSKPFTKILETLNRDFFKFKEEIETVYLNLRKFHYYHYEKFENCKKDYIEKIKKQQDSEVTIDKLAEKTLKGCIPVFILCPTNKRHNVRREERSHPSRCDCFVVPPRNDGTLLSLFMTSN